MTGARALWLALAGFAAPAVFFILRNLGQTNVAVLATTLVWTLLALMMALLAAGMLRALGRPRVGQQLLLGVATLWYLQFHFVGLREMLVPPLPSGLANGLAGAVMLLAAAVFGSRATPMVARFAAYFLLANLALVALPRLSERLAATPTAATAPPVASSDAAGGGAASPARGQRSENVYYVIVDAMASESLLARRFGLDLSGDVSELRQAGFFDAQQARASYNTTYLTLASIHQRRYLAEPSGPPYLNRDGFFPEMLYGKAGVRLVEDLAGLGYSMVHVGNEWGPCVTTRRIRCLGSLVSSSERPASDWLFNYATDVFFDRSALKHLKRLAPRSYNRNDALGTTIEFVQAHPEVLKKPRQFFFIHHMNPHPPFTDADCQPLTGSSYTDWQSDGYRSSAQCAMKRMREFTREVARLDPGAIVVFQGDHGPATHYDIQLPFASLTPEALDERFSIFNAIRLPQACSSTLAPALGNVETINLVMDCLAGVTPDRPVPRSYAGFYEGHPEFGRVHPVEFPR